ncbi:hypothetical protein H8S90_17215 [Olivibacter sp. SDN3]|uniref:hypothetical protein n=1 Tax=Olivibacter sp. SDN3 TaxID=2764720 RepID=UPI001650E009|nr:hypothetical protein [Olivibacter sp. SDN3]QNL48516.1 hypothetical protein H8S90_17215 [Olivibacter sp. SDN3]
MKNVLITGGTEFFAQRVARGLNEQFKVIFGDSKAIPKILLESGRYIDLPLTSRISFNHELLSSALDHNVDIIIPLRKREIVQLSACKDLFHEYDITLVVPAFESLKHLQFISNPGKGFIPNVLVNGESLNTEKLSLKGYTGVCSDTAEGVLLCCLDD